MLFALPTKRLTGAVLLALAAATALSGCGRRGAPEAPPYATVVPADDTAPAARPVEDRPFILDPLL